MSTPKIIDEIGFANRVLLTQEYNRLSPDKKLMFDRIVWNTRDALYAIKLQELIWEDIIYDKFSPSRSSVTIEEVPEKDRGMLIARAESAMGYQSGLISPKITETGERRLLRIIGR